MPEVVCLETGHPQGDAPTLRGTSSRVGASPCGCPVSIHTTSGMTQFICQRSKIRDDSCLTTCLILRHVVLAPLCYRHTIYSTPGLTGCSGGTSKKLSTRPTIPAIKLEPSHRWIFQVVPSMVIN